MCDIGKLSACIPPISNFRVRIRVTFKITVGFRVRAIFKDRVRVGMALEN